MKPTVWLKNGGRLFEAEAGSDLERQLLKQGFEECASPVEDESIGGTSELSGEGAELKDSKPVENPPAVELPTKPARDKKPKAEQSATGEKPTRASRTKATQEVPIPASTDAQPSTEKTASTEGSVSTELGADSTSGEGEPVNSGAGEG